MRAGEPLIFWGGWGWGFGGVGGGGLGGGWSGDGWRGGTVHALFPEFL